MTGSVHLLEPSRPLSSRVGRILGAAAIPWGIATVLIGDALLRLSGVPPGERPSLFVAVVSAIALLPLLIWMAGQWSGPRGPLQFLFRSPQPTMRISDDGVEVDGLTAGECRRFAWSEIGSFDGASPLRSSRWLRAPDGTELCDIPSNFWVVKIAELGQRMRLAELIVSLRPDLYVLVPKFGQTILGGFRRR